MVDDSNELECRRNNLRFFVLVDSESIANHVSLFSSNGNWWQVIHGQNLCFYADISHRFTTVARF